jgi:hypothetical protein
MLTAMFNLLELIQREKNQMAFAFLQVFGFAVFGYFQNFALKPASSNFLALLII